MIGLMFHKYQCIVHTPNSVYLNPKDFKTPPNKVTKENKSFWKKEVEVGGSICKKCYWKFNHQQKAEEGQVDISPNNSMVCIYLFDSFLGPPDTSFSRYKLFLKFTFQKVNFFGTRKYKYPSKWRYRSFNHLEFKRKNQLPESPNKKPKSNSSSPKEVTVPIKELFKKDSLTKGRPPISDEVIDILADLQSKNYVSACQVGDVLRRCGDYWWSKSKDLPEKVLSKQSGLRSLVIKGIGGDFEIAKILSSAKDIWIGTDGGSEEDRNFIELHVMGTLNGEYFNYFLNLIEREHFTGREVASWIAEQFNFI